MFSTRLRGLCTASATAISVGLFATPAFAQVQLASADAQPADAQPAADQPSADQAANTEASIVVTGSRIRRPNLESTVPITSISGETPRVRRRKGMPTGQRVITGPGRP